MKAIRRLWSAFLWLLVVLACLFWLLFPPWGA